MADVAFADGALQVRKRPTFLFGGDLHYFRVRDPQGDVARTHAMWAETLDRMKAAGCNHVSTYVPWDVHAPGGGSYDFAGVNDLGAFLSLARERGMHVILKPGPLITGEWPNGFGSFGAVPAWWKQEHPESLELLANGRPFSFHPLGDPNQRQPAMLDPAWLASVDAWYARFLDEVRPYLGDPVVGLQIDNETNGYWADRFGGPGHAPSSIAHWHGFLERRYGTIDALNAAWGTTLDAFDQAEPPRRAVLGRVPQRDEARARDWYDGGKALVVDYLAKLREMLEAKDVGGLLLTTNDSPFTVSAGDLPLRNAVLLPDGSKNDVAVNVVDLYPSLGAGKHAPLSEPFQTDFFTRLAARRAERATGTEDWIYGAELQGGMYGIGPFRPEVPPAATDMMLLRAVGAGLKGGALYVVRDGLNRNGRPYAYGAALDAAGHDTPRMQVLAKWGGFIERQGDALLSARPVTQRIALVVDGKDAAPTSDAENRQRLRAVEDPALYGMLAAAGFAVDVIDVDALGSDAARGYRAVLVQTPRPLSPAQMSALEAAVQDGGAVYTFLAAPEGAPLANAGAWHWPTLSRRGVVDAELPGFSGPLDSHWNARFLDGQPPSGVSVIAHERTALGGRGRALGTVDRRGRVAHVHVGTNVFHRFNTSQHFTAAKETLTNTASFARALLGVVGEEPLVDTGDVRVLCTARRAADRLFLFMENDNPEATVGNVRLRHRDGDASAWGIEPGARYTLRDELNGTDLGVRSGAQLLADGITVPVGALGTAVVVVTQAAS